MNHPKQKLKIYIVNISRGEKSPGNLKTNHYKEPHEKIGFNNKWQNTRDELENKKTGKCSSI